MHILHFSPILEKIPMLVYLLRLLVIQFENGDSKIEERVKLVLLRNSVVIYVLPETEGRKNAIPPIDLTISISSCPRMIVLGECKEAIFFLAPEEDWAAMLHCRIAPRRYRLVHCRFDRAPARRHQSSLTSMQFALMFRDLLGQTLLRLPHWSYRTHCPIRLLI